MSNQELFNSIVGATFSSMEIASLEMQAAHPYIAQDTALYHTGVALVAAYQNRGVLICEPNDIDPRSDDYGFDGEEWELTYKRRSMLGRMCTEIVTEIKFNPGVADRINIFVNTVKNMHDSIESDLHWQEITTEEADELRGLVSHIGLLCELEADKHFQTV